MPRPVPISSQNKACAALAIALSSAAAISCLAPRASVLLLVIVAIAAGWRLYPTTVRDLLETVGWQLVLATGGLLAYMVVSSAWALDPPSALSKSAGVGAVALCSLLGFAAVCDLDRDEVQCVARYLLGGAFLGLLFVTLEFVSGQAITRVLFNFFPVLRPPGAKDLVLEAGNVMQIARYELNRNVALLILMLWPAMLLLMKLVAAPAATMIAWAAVLLSGGLAFFSEHETSMIAFLVGSLVYLAGRWNSWLVARGLAVLWCLAFIVIVPLSLYAYRTAELHRSTYLPYTAQARIIIWGYTAEKVVQSPLIGIGARSTRVLDSALLPTAEREEGDVFARRPGRHAHNLFLQSWFELGAIGVALVMAFGLAVLGRVALLTEESRPHAYALFSVFMVIAGFAWGMWQTWLLAAYALSALYLAVGARATLPERQLSG